MRNSAKVMAQVMKCESHGSSYETLLLHRLDQAGIAMFSTTIRLHRLGQAGNDLNTAKKRLLAVCDQRDVPDSMRATVHHVDRTSVPDSIRAMVHHAGTCRRPRSSFSLVHHRVQTRIEYLSTRLRPAVRPWLLCTIFLQRPTMSSSA